MSCGSEREGNKGNSNQQTTSYSEYGEQGSAKNKSTLEIR